MESRSRRIAGNFLIYLAAVGLTGGAATKFLGVPAVVSMLNGAGFEGKIPLVASLELISALLIAIPAARSLGLPFASAYLGGAIATDIQHGHPFLPAVMVLAVIWTGVWLRHAQVAWSVSTVEADGAAPISPGVVQASSWLSRLVLLAAAVIFTGISVRYLGDPVGTAGAFKIALGSPAAVTNMRVGFGAFPLAFAIITLSCLLSARRHATGLFFVLVVLSVATAARIVGIALDGPAAESFKVLRPEVAMVALSGAGLFLEIRRRSAAG